MDSPSFQTRTSDRLQLIDNEENSGINTEQIVKSAQRRRTVLLSVGFFCLLVLVAFTCAMIPGAFLIGRNNDLRTIRLERNYLRNQQLLLNNQLGNLTETANRLSKETIDQKNELSHLKNVMRVSKENLLDYFGVQFKSYSNHSVEYAQFSFGDNTINWNFGDQLCLSVQAQLAFPVAANHESVEDLKSSCPLDPISRSSSCWIGLNKETDGSTWVDSNGHRVGDIRDLPWGSGQPNNNEGYDCAYIRDGQLFSEVCSADSALRSAVNVSTYPVKFVCQNNFP